MHRRVLLLTRNAEKSGKNNASSTGTWALLTVLLVGQHLDFQMREVIDGHVEGVIQPL